MAKFWLLMPQMAWSLPAQARPSASMQKKHTTILGLFVLFSSGSLQAADLQTILTNLSNVIIPLTAAALMISYCAGIYMVISGLMQLKKIGVVSQTQHGELGGPLMKMIVGVVLIYLPTSTDTLMNSLFDTGNLLFGNGGANYKNLGAGASLLNYGVADSLSSQWAALANTLVLYIQFIGFISFIKGWFIMSHSAGQGAQAGSFGKALIHIIGGIVAINFVGVVNIINNTINGS